MKINPFLLRLLSKGAATNESKQHSYTAPSIPATTEMRSHEAEMMGICHTARHDASRIKQMLYNQRRDHSFQGSL